MQAYWNACADWKPKTSVSMAFNYTSKASLLSVRFAEFRHLTWHWFQFDRSLTSWISFRIPGYVVKYSVLHWIQLRLSPGFGCWLFCEFVTVITVSVILAMLSINPGLISNLLDYAQNTLRTLVGYTLNFAPPLHYLNEPHRKSHVVVDVASSRTILFLKPNTDRTNLEPAVF